MSGTIDAGGIRVTALPLGEGVTALVTLLAHGGYRRRYKRVDASDAASLVEAVRSSFPPA